MCGIVEEGSSHKKQRGGGRGRGEVVCHGYRWAASIRINGDEAVMKFIVFISFAERGSQTVAEYSRIGRTKALYAISLVFLFPIFRFLLRKPSVLFTFLVMVSM